MITNRASDVEKVRAYLELRTKQRDIAVLLGLSRPRVANIARIIKRARPIWIEWVEEEQLTLKHLEYVITLRPDDADFLLRKAIAAGWSTETLRREAKKAAGFRALDEHHADPDVARIEKKLGEYFGTQVTIITRPGRKDGTLVFRFTDNEELDGLFERMGYQEA